MTGREGERGGGGGEKEEDGDDDGVMVEREISKETKKRPVGSARWSVRSMSVR